MLEPDVIRKKLPDLVHKCYELPKDILITHLKYSENFTYLVTSEKENKKYVLRVNRPGYHSIEELNSELIWMNALRKDTDIHMADVIPGKNGDGIQKLDLDDSENPYYTCTLFSFVEGEGIRGIAYERLLQYQKIIGSICAKLHLHVLQSEEMGKLPRFSWSERELVGKDSIVGDWEISDRITSDQRKILKQAVDIALKRLKVYGKGKDRYGLIHSDLNINNILVDGSTVNVLDFDDCGYGWFLYDLATSVLEYDDTLEDMTRAWVEGYETIRPLSKADKDEIDTFIVLRKIVRIGWIYSHRDNDTVKRVTPRYYEETTKLAEKYIAKYGKE